MMRFLLSALLIFVNFSFISGKKEKQFFQDVVCIHSAQHGLPDGTVRKVEFLGKHPVVVLQGKSYGWNGEKWSPVKNRITNKNKPIENLPEGCGELLASVSYGKKTAIGCENGIYLSSGSKWEAVLPFDENYSWSPRNVRALAADTRGRLWFGAREGVGRIDKGKWKLFTGREGLPYNNFTCAAAGPAGEVWFGTTKGAIRVEDDYFYYRATRRWLPDDHVNDIAVDESGTAWIATNSGLSEIASKSMTYEEKADYFTDQVEARHNRMGFVCQSYLKEQFNIGTSELAISDNDGLYTAMYGAAHAFKYARTKDRKARELAVRSFYACKWLVDITHEPGFPARVIIPIDWPEPVNEQYGHEYNKRKQEGDPFWKDIYPRFPKSKDGKYRWKCDTSSDELAGHYFYYAIFYDLVAETDQEKADVRQVVADITDHLIRHGFCLVDHDGKPTRWANFQPEFFHSVWGWEQRGLNSMMMLSFLNVASHVTGDSKYDEVAKMLRDKHNYHINAMHAKEYFPPENAVPWDNNLCLMSMYGLMNYEKDPELLIMYRNALENAWLHISKQKNAYWDGIYGALANSFSEKIKAGFFKPDELFTDNPLFADAALKRFAKSSLNTKFMEETLRRIPLDLIGYTMDNTHRLDVVPDPTPGQEAGIGWRTDGYALPIDERGHVRLDRDAFAIYYSEGNGYSEHEGTFYLLPYYLALYHNLIEN
ncbi:MAG: hypothetical protein MI975_29460 [Cytophagales bacterium]|nr:hypothetical protein [Cytophagales bacterium]